MKACPRPSRHIRHRTTDFQYQHAHLFSGVYCAIFSALLRLSKIGWCDHASHERHYKSQTLPSLIDTLKPWGTNAGWATGMAR